MILSLFVEENTRKYMNSAYFENPFLVKINKKLLFLSKENIKTILKKNK